MLSPNDKTVVSGWSVNLLQLSSSLFSTEKRFERVWDGRSEEDKDLVLGDISSGLADQVVIDTVMKDWERLSTDDEISGNKYLNRGFGYFITHLSELKVSMADLARRLSAREVTDEHLLAELNTLRYKLSELVGKAHLLQELLKA